MTTTESTAPPTRTGRTVSWGLLDQMVSSAATLIFVVVAAGALPAADVGAVAFAFEFYLVSAMAARGVAGDPLTSRFAGFSMTELQRPIAAAASAALCVGLALGVPVAAAGLILGDGSQRTVLLIIAVALPGLTLQDYVRSALIVQGRVRATFVNDTFWAIGQVPAMGLAILLHPTAGTVLGAWAATGCVAAVIGMIQLRSGLTGPSGVRHWLRSNRDLWPYYLADNLIFQLTTFVFMIVVSATAGMVAMAGVRVVTTMYAPLSLIGRGVITVCVALLARRRKDPAGVRRSAMLISAILTPLPLAWGVVIPFIPHHIGTALFGESWTAAEPLLFIYSFVSASGLFATGVIIGLRALSAGRHSLGGRLLSSLGAAVIATIGGVLGQEQGVFTALAFFFPVQIVIWWTLLRHAARVAAHKSVDADIAPEKG